MTGIKRKIARRTSARIYSLGRDRNIIVELSPGGDGSPGPEFIGLRLEQTRQTYYLPVAFCFREALKGAAAKK